MKILHQSLTVLIAFVWFANGLFAKVLGFVPRHEQIVARILGDSYSDILIVMIGVGELFIAAWVLTGKFSRFAAVLQISLVLTMNVIEFVFARDLLLFGGLNAVFAIAFVSVVFINEFVLRKRIEDQ